MRTNTLSVGVVGAGRVGAVLAAVLQSSGYTIAAVAGESAASRTRIETLLPGVAVDKPSAVAKSCRLLLLAVPDDALDNVVKMLVASKAIHPGQYVVHTSGRHGVGVLAPAAAIGAHVIAMHPALTFTGTDVDVDRVRHCVFGVTCADAERPVAEALVDDISGRLVWLTESERAVYHAALAHGANHLVTLVNQAIALLKLSGSDDPAAVLRPLLTAALDNALDYGGAALTGPIVRGDVATVASHLTTLAAAMPEALESYVALARATASSAVADGRLEPRRAAALTDVLDEALSRSLA